MFDTHTHSKPLFIFQQDIFKTFDSIYTNMLKLAMQRLQIILSAFIQLTLELFTGRFNTVIIAFGLTPSYKCRLVLIRMKLFCLSFRLFT